MKIKYPKSDNKKRIADFLTDVPEEFIQTDNIFSKLYEEYHVSEVVEKETEILVKKLVGFVILGNSGTFVYKTTYFENKCKFRVEVKIVNEEEVDRPYFLENVQDKSFDNLGTLVVSIERNRPSHYVKFALRELVIHEMTHIFQIYKIFKSYLKQSQSKFKNVRNTLDRENETELRQKVSLYIEDRFNRFNLVDNLYYRLIVGFYDLLYVSMDSEINAFTHEIKGILQNIKESGRDLRLTTVEEMYMYQDIVLYSKEKLIEWKQFFGEIPYSNPAIRRFSPNVRQEFRNFLDYIGLDKSKFCTLLKEIECKLYETEYKFRRVFAFWIDRLS